MAALYRRRTHSSTGKPVVFCLRPHKTRDAAAQVHQGMQLDRAFVFPESRPREERKAKIDRSGVEGIGRLLQSHAESVVGVKLPGHTDQHLGEIDVDAPVSLLVGFGQSASGDFATDTGMIEFGPHGTKTRLYVPKTLSIGELREGHAEKLVET